MNINCCKDCNERRVGCHSSCEVYINMKKKHDEIKEKIRKSKYREYELNSVSIKKRNYSI